MFNFINSEAFSIYVLPLLIMAARICDVSIDTVRIIFLSRGKKFLAPLLGFFEAFIFILVISQIMQNVTNIFCYIGYALGFAIGNYIGLVVEEKLALGFLVIRIIVQKDTSEIKKKFASEGFGVTSINADGSTGKVEIMYSIIRRKDLEKVISIINTYIPKAFYSIEEVARTNEGVFPPRIRNGSDELFIWRKLFRKRK